MMLGDSPTKWCWMAAGSPRHEDCVDSSGQCWVCGGQSNRTMPRSKWLGATYTGQNRVKAWHSDVICEPCVFLHSRTFPVPGRPPGKCSGCDGTRAVTKVPSKGKVSRSKVGDPCPKCNGTGLAEFGGNWRNYSVLVEVASRGGGYCRCMLGLVLYDMSYSIHTTPFFGCCATEPRSCWAGPCIG